MSDAGRNEGRVSLTPDSSAVQIHLGIIQDVVSRMANNSASCKTWCITLVSAILVVIADKGEASYAWIALLPVILFCVLDAYYLGQERVFRAGYNNFVQRVHIGQATADDLFQIVPDKGTSMTRAILKAISSFSIYPFYLTLIAMIVVTRFLIL
jgi:hypothetical protein